MNASDSMRLSLLDLFAPPKENQRGVFGLMCSLSADEYFMDAAMERFSGLNRTHRRQYGRLFAILCLDARHKPIQSLPGLYGPWASGALWKKIGLMHAKVALLGFGEAAAGRPDYYRLIVSTGNWTKEAVNNSINLAWFCDYDTRSRENQKQSGRDIIKAAAFWQRLLGADKKGSPCYRIDDVVGDKHIQPFLHDIADNITLPRRGHSARFISNLLPDQKENRIDTFALDSVGAQVINRFRIDQKQRNLLVCGSGFFELVVKRNSKSGGRAKEPAVLRNLMEQLRGRVLTRDPNRWLVINPQTSGAVGQWIRGTDPDALEWKLCRPKHPDVKSGRQPYPFHAKYVFVGNWNWSITNGLIYIGSGNLSRQGFTLGLEYGGNIEAGVVVQTGKCERSDFYRLLGIDPDNDLQPNEIRLDELKGEESEQDLSQFYECPPIACFVFEGVTNRLIFQCVDPSWENLLLTWQDGHEETLSKGQTELTISSCNVDFSSGLKLSAQRDGQAVDWIIPVLTREGMFCLPPRQPKTGHEIIDALMAFPQHPEEDEDEDDEPGTLVDEDNVRGSSPKNDSLELRKALDKFPLHLATTLIETIAEQNQQVTIGQMPDWIERMRRTLIEELNRETKHDLAAVDHRLLSPLINTPGFAPQQSTRAYRRAIRDITDDWMSAESASRERRVKG